MEINIHIESKKIDKDYESALGEYTKRISPWCRLNIFKYKKIEKASPKKGTKAYLVVPGKDTPSSTELSELINTLNIQGVSCIDFIILPEYYHTISEIGSLPDNLANISDTFSISSFTMGSQISAVVLSEQLYRAYTILNNITYHK